MHHVNVRRAYICATAALKADIKLFGHSFAVRNDRSHYVELQRAYNAASAAAYALPCLVPADGIGYAYALGIRLNVRIFKPYAFEIIGAAVSDYAVCAHCNAEITQNIKQCRADRCFDRNRRLTVNKQRKSLVILPHSAAKPVIKLYGSFCAYHGILANIHILHINIARTI